LCVRGEDLADGVLKLAARLHQALNFLNPFVGDVLHPLPAAGHEGERPNGVPLLVLGAMASGPATAAVSKGERSGKQIGRDGEAAEEFELALAETSGLRTLGRNSHMSAIIPAEEESQALFWGMRK